MYVCMYVYSERKNLSLCGNKLPLHSISHISIELYHNLPAWKTTHKARAFIENKKDLHYKFIIKIHLMTLPKKKGIFQL